MRAPRPLWATPTSLKNVDHVYYRREGINLASIYTATCKLSEHLFVAIDWYHRWYWTGRSRYPAGKEGDCCGHAVWEGKLWFMYITHME